MDIAEASASTADADADANVGEPISKTIPSLTAPPSPVLPEHLHGRVLQRIKAALAEAMAMAKESGIKDESEELQQIR